MPQPRDFWVEARVAVRKAEITKVSLDSGMVVCLDAFCGNCAGCQS